MEKNTSTTTEKRGGEINRRNKKMPFIHSRGYCCVRLPLLASLPVFFFFFFFFFITEFPPRRDDVPSYVVSYTRIALCCLLFFYDSDRIIL